MMELRPKVAPEAFTYVEEELLRKTFPSTIMSVLRDRFHIKTKQALDLIEYVRQADRRANQGK